MSNFCKKMAFIGASWVLWPGSNLFAEEPETYTYSNFQMHDKALTLELEIHPHLLQQARVLRDRDGDGQMSQLEFDESKTAIVHYVQQKLSVMLNERMLHADSAAITYRFENSSPSPNRIYVTCRYALLLKPAQLVLRNEMFQELTERSRNYGVLSDGRKNADFAFRSRVDKVSSPVEVEFFANGEWQLLDQNASDMSPAVYWGIAGCSGLLILAVAALIRKNSKRRSRHHKRKPRSPSISAAREHLQYEQA
ncbi:MAG: hypothetical protein ACREOO_26485 [bacterium]